MSKLPGMTLERLPKGAELNIRILAASTGAYRLRLTVARHVPGNGAPVEVEQEDVAMTLADLLLDLQRFAGENLATLATRQLDAGAGKRM